MLSFSVRVFDPGFRFEMNLELVEIGSDIEAAGLSSGFSLVYGEKSRRQSSDAASFQLRRTRHTRTIGRYLETESGRWDTVGIEKGH